MNANKRLCEDLMCVTVFANFLYLYWLFVYINMLLLVEGIALVYGSLNNYPWLPFKNTLNIN